MSEGRGMGPFRRIIGAFPFPPAPPRRTLSVSLEIAHFGVGPFRHQDRRETGPSR
jgi:hypothetical protein